MIDASKLLAFANKLEDDYKEQGYKWLYDKLRYEIVRQNQTELNNNDALDLVICCQATCKYEQISNNVMFCKKHGRATRIGCL